MRDYAPRLRSRAEIGEFDAHPSELGRVLHRADVLATGISVGEAVGLLGPASAVEVYAPVSHRRAIVDEHALSPAAGPVCIRWVLDEMWPVLTRAGDRTAPRAAILLDLLESDEPRARREAALALGDERDRDPSQQLLGTPNDGVIAGGRTQNSTMNRGLNGLSVGRTLAIRSTR